MKKCPFCKADIEDNARFCLYCMKPLNEKEVITPPQRKRSLWWILVVVVLLLAVLIAAVVMPTGNKKSTEDTTEIATSPTGNTQATVVVTQPTSSVPNTDPNYTENQTEPTQILTEVTAPPTKPTQSATQLQTKEPTVPTAGPTQPATMQPTQPTTAPTTRPTQPITSPSPEPTQPGAPTTKPTQPTTKPMDSTVVPTDPTTAPTQQTTEPEAPQNEVVYAYRTAQAGDDFSANYQNTGNDIVITGVTQPAADGVYDIPSYIDGKKVIAVVANAFTGSNAKIVYVPATVKTIWNYAFAGCEMTDIYFRGNAIYTESKAFTGSITIHCAASCSNRDFRYYKNCAADYGATWEEWNG